jgi:endo-1,4-beta-xylanase
MGHRIGGGPRAGRVAERAGRVLLVVGLVLVTGAAIGALLLSATSDDTRATASPDPATHRAGGAMPVARERSGRPPDPPLRASAPAQHLLVGAAVTIDPLRDDARYRHTLATEYDAVTPENAMKWTTIHPAAGRYDFGPADMIVRFARHHDMAVRGHTLVWYREVPSWITQRSWTRPELERVLRDHIHEVVGRYRGRVDQWDVVNEAVDDHGALRDNVWRRVIGPRYVDLAFRWAHEADPGAKLFYNDYGIETPGAKADAVHALVRGLKRRGVPIDGVGIQAHEQTADAPSRSGVRTALASYAQLGLDVGITELDVAVPVPADAEHLRRQAAVYRHVLDACLAVPRCTTLVTWGFTDRHSWVPGDVAGSGDALPFDREYRPKPALETLRAGVAHGRGG